MTELLLMGGASGKAVFKFLAYMFAGLGLLGVFLPLLPTTPFILLAAFFASKGSPEFASWLENHRTFGPAIENWRERRAVPVRGKVLACVMLGISWSILFLSGASTALLAGLGLFFIGLAVFLISRPSY
ncbi:YbaN family protein [Marinobacter sp. NP-4(2019)]|uniref:YbaN family protein n=1 Tax=Marinobacter sp. NP-4(2019) TaxID=2488665 RepID=UPI002B059D72|nr:YbaN family protein [Marinobacter sp. NP-4(2019)]